MASLVVLARPVPAAPGAAVEERFRLDPRVADSLRSRPAPWGFGLLSAATYYRTYSRVTPDGRQECWADTVSRVVEGVMSIRKDWYVRVLGKRWDERAAQALAAKMAAFMFEMKFLPPGRGLWAMGTDYVYERGSLSLCNCAYAEIRGTLSEPLAWIADALANGVGVGYGIHTARLPRFHRPASNGRGPFVVPDSREGWAESFRRLVESYEQPGRHEVRFDYSSIRPKGALIRSFGGVASGPEVLRQAHERLRTYLDAYAEGRTSQTRLIADVVNAASVCIVSGGTRRSALIAVGSLDDPDFASLKDYSLHPEREVIGWASNNSVALTEREHFSRLPEIADRIRDNGEPGVLNFLNISKYGRLGERVPDAASGINPCVTADTWVMTRFGARQVKDMVGVPFTAIVDGKPFDTLSDGFFFSGIKDVFRLETSEGYSVRLTADHKVLTGRGWLPARELRLGDQVALNEHVGLSWDGNGTETEGYLLGHLVGDGTFSPDGRAFLATWDRPGIETERAFIADAIGAMPHRQDWRGWHTTSNQQRLGTRALTELAASFAIKRGSKTVTPEVEEASSDFYRGFLRGLFDTDGHVEGSREKSVSIRLTSIDVELLRAVQRMLLRLGVKSSIRVAHPEGRESFDGYMSHASYRLIIGSESAWRFMETIGFLNPVKTKKWERLRNDIHYRKPFVARVATLVPDGREPVYDATVADIHAFDANGIVAHNCGEIALEDRETCNLCEVFPTRCTSDAEIYEAMRLATFYASTVALLRSHSPENNEVVARNRRIGVSVSGVADWIDATSVSHVFGVLNQGYEQVVRPTNAMLAKEAGVAESIRVTTVKPSGCRPWDALMTTDAGIFTNEELFELSGHREGEEWHHFGMEIRATNGDRLTHTFDNGKAEVFRVGLTYGMEVQSTAEHRWWVARRYDRSRGNRWSEIGTWVQTADLRPGDVLEVKPGVYANDRHAPLAKVEARAISMRADAGEILQPVEMSPDLAWLLGYLWGDGAMSPSRYRIRFVDGNPRAIRKAQRVLWETFGIATKLRPASQARKAEVLEVASKALWHWLIRNDVWKYWSDEIDLIPRVVRASSVEDVLAFLAGLVDADGSVVNRSCERVVILASASDAFARHVQDVALAAGISFGRSLNRSGKNKQRRKRVWLMTTTPESNRERFARMAVHSVKMSEPGLAWSHECEGHKKTRIFGKVESLESLGWMPTFDVEVEASHWYHAGAVKSHNTTSLLAGVSPGMHHPFGARVLRRMRVAQDSPIAEVLERAGVPHEPDVVSPHTEVFEFPLEYGRGRTRSVDQVSAFEQAAIAAMLQRSWADNAVSNTITVQPGELGQVERVLSLFAPQVKSLSMLPDRSGGAYPQMPLERIEEGEFRVRAAAISEPDWSALSGGDGAGESYCDSDSCSI